MRRLHVLRHAKSSWDDPGLEDYERPLSPRGRRAVKQLGRWLADHEVRPQLVLCSTAVRAQQTIERLVGALGDPEVAYLDELYHAPSEALFARVRALPDDVDEVLLVGHNPGLAGLVLELSLDSAERRRIAAKLPTGALVTLELERDAWGDVALGSARITTLVLPRDL